MENSRYTLHHGDNREVLKKYPDNHFDSIVCDPPYELGFMGKSWDSTGIAYDVAMWRECWRVLKPGGHLLAFGGSRTYHRMACAIEDAGFEVRDEISYFYDGNAKKAAFLDSLSFEQQKMFLEAFGRPSFLNWCFGSGFPKSHNVGKAIDKEAGFSRERGKPSVRIDGRIPQLEQGNAPHDGYEGGWGGQRWDTSPVTAEAERWDGWGTALKPAHEPILMGRKPLEGTVAQNFSKWGTGGLNIDDCRVGVSKDVPASPSGKRTVYDGGWSDQNGDFENWADSSGANKNIGRWPANLMHDGSEEVLELFPEARAGMVKTPTPNSDCGYMGGWGPYRQGGYDDSGTAARFFYAAKASREDRDEGLPEGERNTHETVKPTDLMRYLCRLVTPPDGLILDPFAGSGSTGKGAVLEGFRFVGIEQQAKQVVTAHARIEFALTQWRNKTGEIVVTAKEAAQGKASLFDWQGGTDD